MADDPWAVTSVEPITAPAQAAPDPWAVTSVAPIARTTAAPITRESQQAELGKMFTPSAAAAPTDTESLGDKLSAAPGRLWEAVKGIPSDIAAIPHALSEGRQAAAKYGELAFKPNPTPAEQDWMRQYTKAQATGVAESAAMGAPETTVNGAQTSAAQRLADLQASNITPTVPTVTGSRSLGTIAKTVGDVPLAGEPVTARALQNIEEAAQQSRNIAGGYGEAGLPEEGGEALQAGRKQFQYGPEGAAKPTLEQARSTPTRNVGFVPKSERLYGAIPISPDAPASVSNVTAKLKDLAERFPSNEGLNSLLSNPTFAKMYNAIRPGTKEIESQTPVIGTVPAGFKVGETAELAPSGQPTHVTADTGAPMISFGDDGFAVTPSTSIRPTGANPSKLVTANAPYISSTPSGFGVGTAREIAPTGGLNWQDLRNLRSYVGQQMRQPGGELGMGQDEWRSLYGALSDDIRDTATVHGPDALKAFNRANDYYSAGLKRLNDTMGFIEKADSPEKAYYGLTRMGSAQGKGASIDKLTATMKSLPDEMKGDVASTVINRLGDPTGNVKGANPSNFSVGTWATNYANISDKAKDALFGTTGTAQRDSLDTLSRAVTSLKNVERLGNPSRSVSILITSGALAGARFAPLETALSAAATYGGAKALMSPKIASWLASMSRTTTPEGWSNGLARLKAIGVREPIAQQMYGALTNQPQQ